jgi:hypothetical protein
MKDTGMERDDKRHILKAIRSLRADNPLRQQAEFVLSEPHACIEDVQPILLALKTTSWHRRKHREVAVCLVQNASWTDDQRRTISEALSTWVEKRIEVRRPSHVALSWIAAGIFLIFFLLCCLVGATDGRDSITLNGGCGMFLGSVLLSMLASPISAPLALSMNRRVLGRLRPEIDALGHLGQPASIVSIASAYLHAPLRTVAASALARVTAQLRSEDYGALPSQSVRALCRALMKADPQTTLVILQALSIVGDGRAIRAVERIANTTQIPEVREAATDLLPILHQRAAESQAAGLLLRPSNATGAGGEVLLRAASGDAEADAPELLVRAADRPGDGPS